MIPRGGGDHGGPSGRRPPAIPALLAALIVALLYSCGPLGATQPSATPLESGIRGSVRLGPTCPVERRDLPCVTPYVAVLVILDVDQREVARVTSAADGRFEVALAPGDYTVTPTPGGDPFPTAPPQAVTVIPGSFVEIQIDYDTGIR